MNKGPLVSMITPVLNADKYLESCINSVLNQNYNNIEHVFVDAGSKDMTLDILRKYRQDYPKRIRFASGKDKGACDAWNKGWEIAAGDILGWLGADDVLEEGLSAWLLIFSIQSRCQFCFR